MYQGYKIIGLCISKVHDERNFDFLSALYQSVQKQNYRLFIYQTCSDLYWHTPNETGEKSIFDLIHYHIIDALLIFDEAFLDKSVIFQIQQQAHAHDTPVIMINAAHAPGANFIFDYQAGFEQLVRHIINDHHVTDLHMIAGKENEPFSEQRIASFKKVLAENGIPFQSDMLSYGDYWSGPTQAAMEKLISSGHLPDAIICANDMMAITACAVLQEHGFSIPDDIIVTGFDGTEEARYCTPPLTTCGCNYLKMTDEIIRLIENEWFDCQYQAEYRIPYELEISSSCGCKSKNSAILNTAEQLKRARDRLHKYQDDERVLYEMSAQLALKNTPADLIDALHKYGFPDTCIALNNNCLEVTSDPKLRDTKYSFDDTMQLLFQSGNRMTTTFSKDTILPDIDNILSLDHPLIFTALNYIDVPLGFFCFYFGLNHEIYCRVPQFVTAVNNIIGNYRNIKYQQYMTQCMERMYQHDALTGLYNRTGFYKELDALMQKIPANDCQKYLVVSVDLDGLKHINDTYGHAEGDYAITVVANALHQLSLPGKLCARFGGDEMILLVQTDDADTAKSVVKAEIETFLHTANLHAHKPYRIWASVGISISDCHSFQFDQALKQSDMELYREKSLKTDRQY